MEIDGVLVFFHHPLIKNAGTILENILSFSRHSKRQIWYVNTALPMPEELRSLQFKAVVLHYSIFGIHPWAFSQEHQDYLATVEGTKFAFFQDEYRFCKERFEFINRFNIKCVFTLVEERYFDKTYKRFTNVERLVSCIPGYVSQELLSYAPLFQLTQDERTIDIAYRGRVNPPYLGRASLEKREIGLRCKQLIAERHPDLDTDIEVEEESRIYGLEWYQFMASAKAVLGVESGSSIYDYDGIVQKLCEEALKIKPDITFHEMYEIFLKDYEGYISYTTISPRHFEAAALRTCQILFEGHYSGLMTAGKHFIELKKDYSNFEDVIEQFRDGKHREKIADNAYRDLIASNKHTYEAFIQNTFDPVLSSYVGTTEPTLAQLRAANRVHLAQNEWWDFVQNVFSNGTQELSSDRVNQPIANS